MTAVARQQSDSKIHIDIGHKTTKTTKSPMLPLLQPVVTAGVTHNPKNQFWGILLSEGLRLSRPHCGTSNNVKAGVLALAGFTLIFTDSRGRGGSSGALRVRACFFSLVVE